MHGATLKLSYIIHKMIEINSNEQLYCEKKKKKKRDQLPGILHTGVCIALEASVEYRLCTPSWTDQTI